MKIALAVLAATTLVASLVKAEGPREKGQYVSDQALLARPPVYWLKTYSLSPYKEYWTLVIEVRKLDRDLPKILIIFSEGKAKLTQPFATFPASKIEHSQQLSYRLELKSAKKALKNLRKIAAFPEPLVRPAAEVVPMAEVKDKINRLISEKTAHSKELSAMPALSAIVDELLEQLLLVEAVRDKTDAEVLLNMTIQEKR